ncbi:MAG: 2-oxoacid:acceptor oxidoreductase family protein [Patescibacteria group bacterium]|nr:2-oxoacid:acceptor oxidoreductase family protein [Patescibacteria group bacterium]
MKTIKVIWQGLGGEGIKTAAIILARTINQQKLFAQSFPEYGPERSGAKTYAYIRISDHEILSHYPITKPSIVVSTIKDIKFDCYHILATDFLEKEAQIFYFPAQKIAKKFKVKYLNLPLLGALIALLEKKYQLDATLTLNSIKKSKKINPEIIRAGYQELNSIL